MKRLMLLCSIFLFVFSMFFRLKPVEIKGQENVKCDNNYGSIVQIIDNYHSFSGNGVVYSSDSNYMYILTSSRIISNSLNYSVVYENGEYKSAINIGVDKENEIVVLRTEKVDDVLPACMSNSRYIDNGEVQYFVGYKDRNVEFFNQGFVSKVGHLYLNTGYKKIYKNVIDFSVGESLQGIAVFDEKGRLSGIVSGQDSNYSELSYLVESNRLIKIADSIVKTGNYSLNYIKYNVVDYGSLSKELKDYYSVSGNANRGVVVTTFSPFKFLFGGLNQGMVIVEVNGVEIDNMYDLDAQLLRYKKGSNVCLKVIKTNGKEAYYYVKV